MPFFLNRWLLNVVYLVVGLVAGFHDGNDHPIWTTVTFVVGLNILFYISSYITKKLTQRSRGDE